MLSISRLSRCLLLLVLVPIGIFGAVPTTQKSERRTLHILAIGISKYQYYKADEVPSFAVQDARDFTAALEVVARGSFDAVEQHVLLNEDATRATIAMTVEKLRHVVRPRDTFVFFYSGHGITRTLGWKKEEQFYLIPHNFDPTVEKDEVFDRAISSVMLQSWLLSIRAQHQFIVLNSNRSGRGFEGFIARAEEDNKFLGPVARRDLAVLFNNAGSYELDKFQFGLLPYLLIEALKSDVVTGDGIVTAKELLDYAEQNASLVIKRSGNTLTQRAISRLSHTGRPSSYFSGEDFPLGSKPALPQANASRGTFVDVQALRPSDKKLRAHSFFNSAGPVLTVNPDSPASGDDDPEFILPPECAALSEVRPARGTSRNGKDHALLFGTDLYDNWTTLANPTADATAIAEILNTRFGFATEVVKNSNKECIALFLAKYQTKKYKKDEQLLIFFAGHGSYKSSFDGFLIARDSKASNLDPLGISWLAHSLISRAIDSIPCKHIFLVLDSCFGGAMASASAVAPPTGVPEDEESPDTNGSGNATTPPDPNTELITTLMKFRTRRFLTSGGTEYVSDGLPGRHSPFANKFLTSFTANPQNSAFFTVSEIIPRVKLVEPYQPIILYDSWPSNEVQSEFFFFIVPA